ATLADPMLRGVTSEPRGQFGLELAVSGLALSADERFLAFVTGRGETSSVSVWEVGSWQLVRAFAPTRPRSGAWAMTFARDGRSLFVANLDTTILEWDVAGRPAATALWPALLEAPDRAYQAIWAARDRPAEAVRAGGAGVKP